MPSAQTGKTVLLRMENNAELNNKDWLTVTASNELYSVTVNVLDSRFIRYYNFWTEMCTIPVSLLNDSGSDVRFAFKRSENWRDEKDPRFGLVI